MSHGLWFFKMGQSLCARAWGTQGSFLMRNPYWRRFWCSASAVASIGLRSRWSVDRAQPRDGSCFNRGRCVVWICGTSGRSRVAVVAGASRRELQVFDQVLRARRGWLIPRWTEVRAANQSVKAHGLETRTVWGTAYVLRPYSFNWFQLLQKGRSRNEASRNVFDIGLV